MTRAEVLDNLDKLARSGSAALNAARQLALQFPDAVLEHLEVASTPQGGIQFRMPIRQQCSDYRSGGRDNGGQG